MSVWDVSLGGVMFTVDSLTAVDFVAWIARHKRKLRALRDLSEEEFLQLAAEYEGLRSDAERTRAKGRSGHEIGNWRSAYYALQQSSDEQAFVQKCREWSEGRR
jgi:hypothetical protein